MKRFLIWSICMLLGMGLAMAQAPANGPMAKLVFKEKSFDFGDIKQGETVTHKFSFENTGNAPLIITNVSATCGCTVPEWPRDPIAPGEKSVMTVRFNSTGKMGVQNKVITVNSNAANPIERVTIITNVLPSKS